jgi:hypothetical protein
MTYKRTQSITQTGEKTATIAFNGNFVYENYYPSYNTFDEGRIVYKTDSTCFVGTYLKESPVYDERKTKEKVVFKYWSNRTFIDYICFYAA